MNRSSFAFAALLGLSLLPVNGARGQALPNDSDAYETQPKPFSRLFDMIGDCAHGAVSRYEALEQTAKAEQQNDADYEDCKLDPSADLATETQPTGTQDSVAQDDYTGEDYTGQAYTGQDYSSQNEAIAQEETVAQDEAGQETASSQNDSQTVADQNQAEAYQGDDYQGEGYQGESSTAEDVVNRAFDRAVAPPVVNTLADDADYYQAEVAAPTSPVASDSKDYGYDYEYGYDKDQEVEPAPQPVTTDVAAPVDAADPYDADLVDTYQASEVNADDVAAADSSSLGRQSLLGMANLLGRLGAALQAASTELTSLAAKDTTNINR